MRRKNVFRVLCAIVWGSFLPNCVLAQPPKREVTETEQPSSDLTKGLLDLLDQPHGKESSTDQPPRPGLMPADVGLDKQDLSEQTANPLESVRQSMLIAAGYLQRGAVDAQTRQLQSDIVTRLDELIAQFDNADSTQQSSQPEQAEPPSQDSPPSSPQSTQATAKQPRADDPDAPQQMQTGPGQLGPKAEVIVDAADPRAMQQSVWGHLPERTRTQMQSRMVEQFLPSYRAQIEAYFKALLEQE